jgi:hypothetical protein
VSSCVVPVSQPVSFAHLALSLVGFSDSLSTCQAPTNPPWILIYILLSTAASVCVFPSQCLCSLSYLHTPLSLAFAIRVDLPVPPPQLVRLVSIAYLFSGDFINFFWTFYERCIESS